MTVNFLQIKMLWPFPRKEVQEILERARIVVLLEDNHDGQLGQLIAEETGIQIERKLLKYNGRPFSQSEVEAGLCEAAEGEAERIVVSSERMVVQMPARTFPNQASPR